VRSRFRYDVSPATALRFAEAPGGFVERLLAVGSGDCDVKNGFNVLLLRRAGIAARLAVGIVGKEGRSRPGWHAWTEYHHQGRWHDIDATGEPNRSPAARSLSLARRDPRPREGPTDVTAPAAPPMAAEPAAALAPGVVVGSPMPAQALSVAPQTDPRATLAWLVALLGVAAVVARAWQRRVSERIVAVGVEGDAGRAAVAQMVRDALLRPEVWRGAQAMFRRRLLPALGGERLSVREALGLAEQGRLAMARRSGALARAVREAGVADLDASSAPFGDLVVPLLGAVDLDALERLDLVEAAAAPDQELLAAVNELLAEVTDVRCVLLERLGERRLYDIDLSRLGLPRALLPRRIVALSPYHKDVILRLRLLARRPERGAFVWIDWLVDRSGLLAGDAARLRELAAARALGLP
jgi:hypothetical protein